MVTFDGALRKHCRNLKSHFFKPSCSALVIVAKMAVWCQCIQPEFLVQAITFVCIGRIYK